MPAPLALITGASGGIGAALAREFATNGYDVALSARSEDALTTLAAELSGLGARAHVIPADLAAPDGVEGLVQGVETLELEVDALVNNAGYTLMGPFADADIAEQLAMLDVNVRALTALTGRFAPAMAARRRGGVLNVASTAAFTPGPNMAVYYASKAYVLSFTAALSSELAGSGAHATALCPGPTRSGFQERGRMEGARLLQLARLFSAESVARAGYRGFARKRRVVVPGFTNKLSVVGLGLMPRPLALSVLKRLQTAG